MLINNYHNYQISYLDFKQKLKQIFFFKIYFVHLNLFKIFHDNQTTKFKNIKHLQKIPIAIVINFIFQNFKLTLYNAPENLNTYIFVNFSGQIREKEVLREFCKKSRKNGNHFSHGHVHCWVTSYYYLLSIMSMVRLA